LGYAYGTSATSATLGALAGAAKAIGWGVSTASGLGLGATYVFGIGRIFDPKGNAQAYEQAFTTIQAAEAAYYFHRLGMGFDAKTGRVTWRDSAARGDIPSQDLLTPDGETLYYRVSKILKVLNDTLASKIPDLQDLKAAQGETTTPASPAKPAVGSSGSSGSEGSSTSETTGRPETKPPRSGSTKGEPPEIIPGTLTEEAFRAEVKRSLAKEGNNPDADVYKQILIKAGLDPETIPGQSAATRVVEAYKRNPDKRQEIAQAVLNLQPSSPPNEIVGSEPTDEQITVALKKSLAKQEDNPDADVYKQILIKAGLDPETIAGQFATTKILEAYKKIPTQTA